MLKHISSCLGLLLTLFFIQPASAQLAIKAGINVASLSEEPAEENIEDFEEESILGFQAGLVAEIPISEGFAIQPELLWVQKGGRRLYELAGSSYEQSVTYNYVQVPVLAKVKAGETDGSGLGLYFFGGPFVGYALNGKVEQDLTVAGVTTESEFDIEFDDEDNQRRIDWGASFGLGANLGALFVDLRYDLGINNLLDDDAINNNDNDPYLRTRGIGLTAGFVFGQ
jgi:hypothetical protein